MSYRKTSGWFRLMPFAVLTCGVAFSAIMVAVANSATPSAVPSTDTAMESLRQSIVAERQTKNDEIQGVRGELERTKSDLAAERAENARLRAASDGGSKPPQTSTVPAWTVLQNVPGLYVAPAGNDEATGTQDKPLRTIGAALAKKPKRVTVVGPGDYRESVDVPGGTQLVGVGFPRPRIVGGDKAADGSLRAVVNLWYATDVSIVGIEVTQPDGHRGDGIVSQYGGNLLIEDVLVANCNRNITVIGSKEKPHVGLTLRGVVDIDAWSVVGPKINQRPQGLYLDYVNKTLVEDSVFDRNGWRTGTATALPQENHNVYLSATNGPSTWRRVITARSGSHGLKLLSGGTVENCLFITNPIHVTGSGDDLKVTGSTFIGDQRLAGDSQYDPTKWNGDRRGWGVDIGSKVATATGNWFYAVPTPIKGAGPGRVTAPNDIQAKLPPLDVDAFLAGARDQSRVKWDARWTAGAVR